jgi:dynein heavy chain
MAEELDPALDPILTKYIDKTGSLRLGDKLIPYNHDFKLFMVTTLPNPRYSPET